MERAGGFLQEYGSCLAVAVDQAAFLAGAFCVFAGGRAGSVPQASWSPGWGWAVTGAGAETGAVLEPVLCWGCAGVQAAAAALATCPCPSVSCRSLAKLMLMRGEAGARCPVPTSSRAPLWPLATYRVNPKLKRGDRFSGCCDQRCSA